MRGRKYPRRPIVASDIIPLVRDEFEFTVPVTEIDLRALYPDASIVGFVIRDNGQLLVVADDGS